jgi:hypothetical protein
VIEEREANRILRLYHKMHKGWLMGIGSMKHRVEQMAVKDQVVGITSSAFRLPFRWTGRRVCMHLEDMDFNALINQMWGSEANLQSFLDSEVPHLCERICGPNAPVPAVQVMFPPLKKVGRREDAYGEEIHFKEGSGSFIYRPGLDGSTAKICISVLMAGHRLKLAQFLAYALIHHWEALGARGEEAYEYPEQVDSIIKGSCTKISEAEFKDSHSPKFVAKAVRVARDLEVPLGEFLFPKLSLTVYMTRPEEGTPETAQ